MNPNPTIFDPYKFEPGPVLLSSKVKDDLECGLLVDPLIHRHCRGDYGDAPESIRQRNDEALDSQSDRICSEYNTKHFGSIWIITERHPSLFGFNQTTFVLHPEEHPDAQ